MELPIDELGIPVALLAGFLLGLFFRSPRPAGAVTWPVCHVSFEPNSTEEERLQFLDSAAQAIRDGRLGKPKKLGDQPASDQSY
ncbi:hypothetical protein C3E98_019210 [Pseudomonas sp. MWU13-2625]|nr:hypothetical protein C3E98_019210 [Pseudomonas sp. MWU13-2625]